MSSADMQSLWARVLAGEVERAGSTSIRTLGILKDLDQSTARLFSRFCSVCVFLADGRERIIDARVPSLGGNAAQNSLLSYGLQFDLLNRLNEHGLIISDYNSYFDYGIAMEAFPFRLQGRHWALVPEEGRQEKGCRLSGVALTRAGRELSRVVELEPMDKFTQGLVDYLRGRKLEMVEVECHASGDPSAGVKAGWFRIREADR